MECTQLRVLICLILIVYEIIPILIFIRAFRSEDTKINKIRLKYSIPSIILIIGNIVFTIYALFIADYNVFTNNYIYLLIPLFFEIICILSLESGKIKERYVIAQIGAEKVEDTRFGKGRSKIRVNMISGIQTSDVLKMEEVKKNEIEDLEKLDMNKDESDDTEIL